MLKKKGFTLIELIIVITILGILAAVAIPKYFDVQSQAKYAALKAALGSVRSAIGITRSLWIASGSPGATSINGVDFTEDGWPTFYSVAENSLTPGGTDRFGMPIVRRAVSQYSAIMENGDIPDNPYSTGKRLDPTGKQLDCKDIVEAGTKPTGPGNSNIAWIYSEKTGGFWANTKPGWDL